MFWIIAASVVCLAFGFFLGVQGSIFSFKRLDPSEQRRLFGVDEPARLPPGWKMPETSPEAEAFARVELLTRERQHALIELIQCWCVAKESSPDDAPDPMPPGEVYRAVDAMQDREYAAEVRAEALQNTIFKIHERLGITAENAPPKEKVSETVVRFVDDIKAAHTNAEQQVSELQAVLQRAKKRLDVMSDTEARDIRAAIDILDTQDFEARREADRQQRFKEMSVLVDKLNVNVDVVDNAFDKGGD